MTTITIDNLLNFIAEEFSTIAVNEFNFTGEEDSFDDTMEVMAIKKIYLFSSFQKEEDDEDIVYEFNSNKSIRDLINDELKSLDLLILKQEMEYLIF